MQKTNTIAISKTKAVLIISSLLLLAVLIPMTGISQTATVTTILNDPSADVDDALALDSQGNLYGSNFAGTTVYKITPSGDVSPFVTGLANPNGLAFDSDDNLFVVEYSGGAIHKYDITGNLLETFAVGGFPSGLVKAYHSDNMIFTTADFGDVGNNGVFELKTDGTINTLYQGNPLVLPVGLTYGPSGVLYIGDYLSRVIYRIPKNGGLEYVATVPAPDNFVPFLAFITYSQGFLYGTVYGENKIYKIDPKHVDDVEIYSGSTFGDMDGDISEATYAFPAGILANKSGNIMYVSEYSGIGNIRKITRGNGNGNNRSKSDDYHESELVTTFTVFPNPASNLLNIQLKGSFKGDHSIEIYDFSANKVYESKVTSDGSLFEETISLIGWKAGIYQVIVSNGTKKYTKKIIVE